MSSEVIEGTSSISVHFPIAFCISGSVRPLLRRKRSLLSIVHRCTLGFVRNLTAVVTCTRISCFIFNLLVLKASFFFQIPQFTRLSFKLELTVPSADTNNFLKAIALKTIEVYQICVSHRVHVHGLEHDHAMSTLYDTLNC